MWKGENWEALTKKVTQWLVFESDQVLSWQAEIEGRANTVHKEKGKFAIVFTVRKYTDLLFKKMFY